jgi:serine/threonine-protein kinase HipA
MKLAPGHPLSIGLQIDTEGPPSPIGRLAWADGVAQLEWSPEAISAGLPISPLHYPLEPGLHPARSRSFDGLHGFLADSLPDAWGTLLLRRQLQKLGGSLDDLNPVDRLTLVGRRGRGALVFEPETLADKNTSTIDLDQLAAESQNVLRGEGGDLDELFTRLGGGSGGARPKVHVTIDDNGSVRAGDMWAGSAAGEWIVKFPALVDPPDIGPVEEAYARMARAAGVTIAETRLIPSAVGRKAGGGGHFATRRFDRPSPGKRLHMVSLGGAMEASPHMPSLDYDGFLSATLSITRDMRDVEQAFRRMVFNVLAHNRDDHVRQHAYLMDTRGEWHLAPAFDLTFAHGPGGEHYMAVMGEGRNVTGAHVAALGAGHGIAKAAVLRIIDEVRSGLARWPQIAVEVGVQHSAREIGDRLATVDAQFA